MSWTRYCLSGVMLRELDNLHCGASHVDGPTRKALLRRELIETTPSDGTFATYRAVRLTDAGEFALQEARSEGWLP